MDLSASSRIITSALTSLEVPLHEYGDDVEDEIHLDGEKDDNGDSPTTTTQDCVEMFTLLKTGNYKALDFQFLLKCV